jgi:hypothetical protein
VLGNALADLAVTGTHLFTAFRNHRPQDAHIVELLLPQLSGGTTATRAQAEAAVHLALTRAYTVAWSLRGFVDRPEGWIAVSGEDDSPHRPVNVPGPTLHGARLPQFDLGVSVNATAFARAHSVQTRYIVAGGRRPRSFIDPTEGIAQRLRPPELIPAIPPDRRIILYVHGHSSRLEECLDIAGPLTEQGFLVISMDLPSSGYAQMLRHQDIGDIADPGDVNFIATTGPYPVLEFIEQFIVDFVDALERQQGRPLKHQVACIAGGSLGGNMGLRLAQRNPYQFPWLNNIVSWSPASTWGSSWARARLGPGSLGSGTHLDWVKFEGVRRTRDRARAPEQDQSRRDYFVTAFEGGDDLTGQADRWYRGGDWQPCKESHIQGARVDRQEIYNEFFRTWHWRVAHEQLIFMHYEAPEPGGLPRYQSILSRVLLSAGEQDNGQTDRLYDHVRGMATRMVNTPGNTLWLLTTGHSIHNEHPRALAHAIQQFLPPLRPSPYASETWGEWMENGSPALSAPGLAFGKNEDGRLEVFGIGSQDGRIWHAWQTAPNEGWTQGWVELHSGLDPRDRFEGHLAVGQTHDGRMELYARLVQNWIAHVWQRAPNSGWGDWSRGDDISQFIGGALDGPAVEVVIGEVPEIEINQGPKRIQRLVAVLTNHRVHIRGQDRTEGWPAQWTFENLDFIGTPAISTNLNGLLEIFARHRNGNVYHIRESEHDRWDSNWEPLSGGVVTGDLAAARNMDGRLEVFGRGTNGELWHIWQTTPNGGWSPWTPLGGSLAENARPAVALNAWGQLQVFVRTDNNSIQYRRQRLDEGVAWSDWVTLGGEVRSDPIASCNANGTLIVGVLGPDYRFMTRSQTTVPVILPISATELGYQIDSQHP